MPRDETSSHALRGRIGAYKLHAAGKTNTVPARAAFLARFENEVDPKRELTEAERARRALMARKAYFAQLAYRSAAARRKAVA